MKPYPQGIYHLLSSPNENFWTGIESNPSLLLPWVSGFRGRTSLAKMKPTNAPIDWSGIDGFLDVMQFYNKKLTLSISVGIKTPDWVFDEQPLATRFPADPGDGVYKDMPLPWEQAYQTKLFDFIQEFGEKYDNNPYVEAVFFTGFQQIVEVHVTVTTVDDTSYNNAAIAAGYANKSIAWTTSTKLIIDQWMRSFPNTPKLLTHSPSPWEDNSVGKIDIKNVEDWATAKYGDLFGISISFLKATVSHTGIPSVFGYPRGAQPISVSTDQSRFYADPQPPTYPPAPIPISDLCENGYDQGRQYIEIYNADMLNTTNHATLQAKSIRLLDTMPAKGFHRSARIQLAGI